MVINHLIYELDIDKWGGISQTVLEYNNLLKKRGHVSKVCCSHINKNHKNIHRQWGLDITLLSLIPPHLKNYDFDILHWHGVFDYLWLMAPHLIRKKIPIIMSLHCPETSSILDINFNGRSSRFWLKSKSKSFWPIRKLIRSLRDRRFKSLLPQVKAFICHSHEDLKVMRECFPEHRVEYFPHGVDLERFSKGDGSAFRKKYGIPESAFMVLTVARIDPSKKQHLLIELLPEILKTRPDTCLVFVGGICDSKYKIELENKILELKVEKFVIMIPGLYAKSQDLVDAYHACDLFMLPRTDEIFGIVFVEAFSAGKCVIGARSGGVPKVVTEGVTGLLHKPDDKLDMLSCFKKVALDSDYRNKLGSAAKDEAYQKFNWAIIENKLIDLYQSVLEDNK